MAVTLRDVAREAEVSESAVSLVLRGHRSERFPEATRRRIQEVAKRMGYRPNVAARSLTMNRSFLIGVLINAANRPQLSTAFLRGLQSSLGDGDYSPIVFSHRDPKEQAECLRNCLDRRVDGLIANLVSWTPMAKRTCPFFEPIVAREMPLVEVFGRFLPGVPSVNIDNVAIGRTATQHLIELGHRRIAMLTHARYGTSRGNRAGQHFDAWERYLGYERAMKEAGLEPVFVTHAIHGEVDVIEQFLEGGYDALPALFAHEAQPTAVVCYNDYEAYGLVRAAREQGVPLPERLSVVGYGDLDLSRLIAPALTTVPVPAFEVGRRAAAALLERIDEQVVEDVLVESELVVRESTRRLD